MKKNYLFAATLIITLVLSLGIGSFMDAAAAQLQIDTPTLKPTIKATNTPLPKLTSTPTLKPTNTPTNTPTDTPTIKPTIKVTNTLPTKLTTTPTKLQP
jgi:hypothetical protein